MRRRAWCAIVALRCAQGLAAMKGEQSHQGDGAGDASGRIAEAGDATQGAVAGPPPTVSFIVATYNVRPYIEEAIASALSQRGASIELVIVDDGSDDGTVRRIEELAAAEPRVRLVARTDRRGPAAARNIAMAAARGEWIAVLDGDDFIAPERSQCLIDLAAATSADIVADNYQRVDLCGRPLGTTMIPSAPVPYAVVVDVAGLLDGNIAFSRGRATLGAVKPMIRRQFLVDRAIAYRTDLAVGEDYDLLLCCLAAGARFVVGSGTTYKYRMRAGSQSWRLERRHIDMLLRAHEDAGLPRRFAGQPTVLAAASRYETALARARSFLDVVEAAKGKGAGHGLMKALGHPEAWPLLGRFGVEAAGRKAGLWP